jgi:hypothetical protein
MAGLPNAGRRIDTDRNWPSCMECRRLKPSRSTKKCCAMIQKLCRSCHQPFRAYSTLQSKCANCVKGFTKPRKGLNPVGKQAKMNKEDREQWIKNNPPDKNGVWLCYLNISPNCYIYVNKRELNVEHKESKLGDPISGMTNLTSALLVPPATLSRAVDRLWSS